MAGIIVSATQLQAACGKVALDLKRAFEEGAALHAFLAARTDQQVKDLPGLITQADCDDLKGGMSEVNTLKSNFDALVFLDRLHGMGIE